MHMHMHMCMHMCMYACHVTCACMKVTVDAEPGPRTPELRLFERLAQ